MNKIKILSLALSVFTTSAVVIAAATSNGIKFGALAESQPYFITYGNGDVDLMGMGSQEGATLVHDDETGYEIATSRYTTLGFYGFDSYGTGDNFATFNSANEAFETQENGQVLIRDELDVFDHACFFNLTPINGLIGGVLETVSLQQEEIALSKTFSILCFFSDHLMTPGNDPFTTHYDGEPSIGALVAITYDIQYGIINGNLIKTGQTYSVMPNGNNPVEVYCVDEYNPETEILDELGRYLGSFPYFYVAIYGTVAIKSLAFGYSCEALPADYFFMSK